jgi:hypothetical protein
VRSDRPPAQDGDDFIGLVLTATDLADKIQRILDKSRSPQSKPQASPGPLILGDERSNKLIAVARPGVLDRVGELLGELDIPLPGDGQASVYALKNAEAKDVASNAGAAPAIGSWLGDPPTVRRGQGAIR